MPAPPSVAGRRQGRKQIDEPDGQQFHSIRIRASRLCHCLSLRMNGKSIAPGNLVLPTPPSLHLIADLAPADWVVQRLSPWRPGGARLESFLPDTFKSYARVLHPSSTNRYRNEERPWADLAERRGIVVGPATSFLEASGLDPSKQSWNEVAPMDGSLPESKFRALKDVLASATSTPEVCWFCIWAGYGFWRPSSSATLTAVRGKFTDGTTPLRPKRPAPPASDDIRDIPKVRTFAREYFLFRGRLADQTFQFELWYQSPNIWWPEDRAWCVATEIDGFSTYVGGSRDCISKVLGTPDLEAVEVDLDVRMDPGAY